MTKEVRQMMSLKARQELLVVTAPRYQQASKKEKQTILDEFVAATNYHRKYANALLFYFTAQAQTTQPITRSRPRYYDDEVKEALIIVWEATNRICSKRLVPFLPEITAVLERHGRLSLAAEVKTKLLTISPATVDRLLYPIRYGHQRGLSTTKRGTLLKNQIPVRTFSDWNEKQAGFTEADLVAHCGGDVGGNFLCTLVMTDVLTGWTECFALLFRDQAHVLQAIERAHDCFPFPILGLDTDNGSEFINYALLDYCEKAKITFTRCRPYRKNDQCFVEQKNGNIVRQFVGYDRFEGIEPYQLLDELYQSLRLYINFFQPSLKLIEKKRRGSKVSKKYDKAQTPYQRVLAAKVLSEPEQQQLQTLYDELDPIALLQRIQLLQDKLWRQAYHKPEIPIILMPAPNDSLASAVALPHPAIDSQTCPARAPTMESVTTETATVTTSSQKVCLISTKRTYRRTKPRHGNCDVERWWRTRPDPFAAVWDEVAQHLEQAPSLSAKTLFLALQQKYPWQFTDRQLRTFQRRVKAWRLDYVEQLQNEAKNVG